MEIVSYSEEELAGKIDKWLDAKPIVQETTGLYGIKKEFL